MVTASYPKAIASWTPRIDQVDTVFAADPNTLAAELIAVEQTLGSMPQVESAVPVGNPVTYASVSARISASMLNSNLPYVSLYLNEFNLNYGGTPGKSVFNTYKKLYDPYGYFNGSDITIQATGRYLVDCYQGWEPYSTGWLHLSLYTNDSFLRGQIWDWDLPPIDQYSPEGSNGATGFLWMGVLPAGTRLRVASQNGTPKNPYKVLNGSFKVQYIGSDPAIGNQPGNTGKPG